MSAIEDLFKTNTLTMSRTRRTRILIDGDPALAQHICAQIERHYVVDLISGPQEVLVMNLVRETARQTLFNLGEALLVECRVEIRAKACGREADPGASTTAQGIGLLLGRDRCRAYELAVIDAAFALPEAAPEQEQWIRLLEQEEGFLEELRRKGQEILEMTHVEFNSMLTADDSKEGAW